VLLHDRQEFDDDLGAGSNHDLTLAGLLGIVDALEGIVKDGGSDHLGGIEGSRFSSRENEDLRCLSRKLLVSSSLEQEECPFKGSSARVAKDERIRIARPENATIQARIRIAHLRPAEERMKVDIPLGNW